MKICKKCGEIAKPNSSSYFEGFYCYNCGNLGFDDIYYENELYKELQEYKQLKLTPNQLKQILELFCWSQNFNGEFELFMKALTQIQKIAKKYDDLEEQGRLIILACPIGTPVYYITEDCEKCNDKCDYNELSEFNYCHNSYIKEIDFQASFNKYIGKSMFLTEEEAEKVLEEKLKRRECNDK